MNAEISRMENVGSLLQARVSNNTLLYTVVKQLQSKYFFFNAVSRTSVLIYVTLSPLNSGFDGWIFSSVSRIIRRSLHKNITKNECRNTKDGECRISVASACVE